jgi:nicotinate-nucleotide adenylyltransferase
VTPLLGGAFDPPHNGHVALAAAVRERFGEPVILVAEHPGHKATAASADDRLALARAAFPGYRVELDPNARTIDLLREGRFPDPLVVIGADEYRDFQSWKEPAEVLRLARIAVATRPGFPGADDVELHVERFEIEPLASRELRARIAAREPIDGFVPPAVAALIRERGLYVSAPGYNGDS